MTSFRLAKKFGLKIVKKLSFDEYFKDRLSKGNFLLKRMSAFEVRYV